MGLPRAAVNLLLNVAGTQAFSGRIATLGRQHVYLTAEEVRTLARAAGVPLRSISPGLHRDPGLRAKGYVSDDSLYEMLGFDESVRIDRSDYEDAEDHLDLNQSVTPAHLCNAFDVVLDSGTVEHVFDLGRAMTHCLNLTRPGGRIIHLTPSSNSVNHGFYSVSPTLFADFYAASGCTIEQLRLCRMPRRFERGSWQVYDCLQTDRNWMPLGRLDGAIWFTFAVIRKHTNSVAAVPQQSFYVSTWDQSQTTIPATSDSATEPADSRAGRLLRRTASWPLLNRTAWTAVVWWRQFVNWLRERRRGRIPFPRVGRF